VEVGSVKVVKCEGEGWRCVEVGSVEVGVWRWECGGGECGGGGVWKWGVEVGECEVEVCGGGEYGGKGVWRWELR